MQELSLSQEEADYLITIEKLSNNQSYINLPDLRGTVDILFYDYYKKEEFIISYNRHYINLSKRNHHLRCRKSIGLVRLDLDGPPHRNPDGIEIRPRHLHLYREGYALKWAYEVPKKSFSNLDDSFVTLQDFLKYCNVQDMPNITKGIFA